MNDNTEDLIEVVDLVEVVYDILAGSEKPMSFNEIISAVHSRYDFITAEHVRVAAISLLMSGRVAPDSHYHLAPRDRVT